MRSDDCAIQTSVRATARTKACQSDSFSHSLRRYFLSYQAAQETRRHREDLQCGSSPVVPESLSVGNERQADRDRADVAEPSVSPSRVKLRPSLRSSERASAYPPRAEDSNDSSWQKSQQFLATPGENDKLNPTPVARPVRPTLRSLRQPMRPPWLRQLSTPDQTARVETPYTADSSFVRDVAPQAL